MVIIILIIALLAGCLGLVWYLGKDKPEEASNDIDVITPGMAEKLLAKDFQSMIEVHKQDVTVWYTTLFELTDFLDSGNELNIDSLTNVFQSVYPKEKGSDVYVTSFKHKVGVSSKDVQQDFWMEDNPMIVFNPRITFEDALNKLMASNYPKPHSKQCALRNQVGPKSANAQYIFGNVQEVLFVDSVTGEVSNKNPFFNN